MNKPTLSYRTDSMAKAISYIRFSALHQGKGSSVARQEEMISNWFEQNPEVIKSNLQFSDLGKSGYSGKHLEHGLGKILAAIESGEINAGDFILVEAVDRIGRLPPMDMISLIQSIVVADVNIVTLEDGVVYSTDKLNTDQSLLFILVGKVQQAHDYSKRLSNRISAAYEKKRRKARQGESIKIVTSYWLDTSGKLIPERAEMVRECIDLYLKGRGHRRIILDLQGKYPALKTIHPSTLKRWFKHRSLIGEWNPIDDNQEAIPNVFEPLIDDTTFYALQREAKRRTRQMSPEQTYDISGLVVCSNCGSRYHIRRKVYKDRVIIYLNCSQYLKRGSIYCDNKTTWPYELIRYFFENSYEEYLGRITSQTYDGEKEKELDTLRAKIEDVDLKIKKRMELFDELPMDAIKDALAILDDEKKKLKKQVATIEASLSGDAYEPSDNDFGFEVLDALNNIYEDLDKDEVNRRELLKKAGYRLEGYLKTMKVKAGPAGEITWKLVKRSTKYDCYLIEEFIPAHRVFDAGVSRKEELAGEFTEEEYTDYEDQTIRLAINRDGVLYASDTESWEEILENLSLGKN